MMIVICKCYLLKFILKEYFEHFTSKAFLNFFPFNLKPNSSTFHLLNKRKVPGFNVETA